MNKPIVFEENQRFTQWWLWMILILTNIPFIWGIYRQMIQGIPFGDKPMSNTGLLVVETLVLLLTISFLFLKLETKIDTDGIEVRFFPFTLKALRYSWDEISEAYVRTYAPILEFGGWGLRYGFFSGKGKALNVSGNQGLQLILKNGKKLLIGTNKEAELSEVLKRLKAA